MNDPYLAEDMIENPEFYGIRFVRSNPCCERHLSVTFHPHQLEQTYEHAGDAVHYLKALTECVEEYLRRFATDPNGPNIDTECGPCISCVKEGNVDQGWMDLHGVTIESLLAEYDGLVAKVKAA